MDNAELTFTPKLNDASLKLVETGATKCKSKSSTTSEIRKSREKALVAEANAAFTFHPMMNSKSKKIISKIRRHEDRTRNVQSDVHLSFELRDNDISSMISSDETMSISSRETSFETASVHVAQEAETFIQEVLSSCKGEISSDEEKEEREVEKPFSFSQSLCEKDHGKRKKPPQRRAFNVPCSLPYNNADYLQKIRFAKETALNAIRLKRIFTILGPYPYLRKSLQKRGWIEKFGEHSSQPILGSPQAIRPRPAKKKKKSGAQKLSSNSSDTDDLPSDDSDSDSTVPVSDPEFCRIVSRLLKDITPTFIWTIKRDDIDFKYLNRDQIVNHYCKASSFTTKIGLCQHLRSLPWFDSSDSTEFFPRCYQLYSEEDRDDFIEDFEICASVSILRIYKRHYEEWTHAGSPPAPPGSTENTATSTAVNTVPISTVTLAVHHLQLMIKLYDHEYLDMPVEPRDEMSPFKRKTIVNHSYSLISNDFTFSDFIMATYQAACDMLELFDRLNLNQKTIDGATNTWIMKPGAKSRGRGVVPQNNLEDIMKLASSSPEEKWVIQKYIEKPLLVHGTKFDIRQWFMVTDWNPLTLYFYQDSYLRFGSRPFTLDDFDPCIHLCNNSIQKKFMSAQGKTEASFAEGNMWTSSAFKKYLDKQGELPKWDAVIYPGMKKAIHRVMMTIQDIIEDRKNSFELYGADFMLDEGYNPWLIEINCSPAMGGTTRVTEKLCAEVLDDCIKVIIDKRENKNTSTGKWEVIYKQPLVTVPPYIGVQLALEGKYIPKPAPVRRKAATTDTESVPAKKTPRHNHKLEVLTTPRRVAAHKTELKSSKIVGVTVADETQCNMNYKQLVCKHTEKYKKELYSSLTLKNPDSCELAVKAPGCGVTSSTKVSPVGETSSAPQLPSIVLGELRTSPHLSTLSISPISSIPTEDKWLIKKQFEKKGLGAPSSRVPGPSRTKGSELIPTNINPYRLQQIISRHTKPKHLDMLSLQNRYSHTAGNSVKIVDIKPKRRSKIKKVTKVKTLSKLANCPHCDTKNNTGIILNLLKSGSCGISKGTSKKGEYHCQRPKKHFRVSLSQVSTMAHSIVDIQQSGSALKIVGEQTSS